MSLRRDINKAQALIDKDPIIYKIQKSLKWQQSQLSKIRIPANIVEETAAKVKISDDGLVYYDDNKHLYFTMNDKGVRAPLYSVTSLLSAFKPEFKEDEMSMHCAKKEDYTTDFLDKSKWDKLSDVERSIKIKDAWHKGRDEANAYGTFAHACFEHQGRNPMKLTMDVFDEMSGKFGRSDGEVVNMIYEFTNFWYRPIFRHRGDVRFEMITYDLDIGIAGQSDVIIIDHKNKLVYVIDYKTNKVKPGTDEDKSYQNMRGPLSHLPSTNLVHYQLQLCLYQVFLVKQLGYGYGENTILWANRATGKLEAIPVKIENHYDDILKIYDYLSKKFNSSMKKPTSKALFIDLDGTIIEPKVGNKKGFPLDAYDWKFKKGILDVLIALYEEHEYTNMIIVTNQGGIPEFISPEEFKFKIEAVVEEINIYFDMYYMGKHHFTVRYFVAAGMSNPRRKPSPLFFKEAAQWNGLLVPKDCIMIGDRPEDEEFAKNCGMSFSHIDGLLEQINKDGDKTTK